MILSKEQFELLKAFYENKIILYNDLPKYKTKPKSSLIRSLTKKRFIRTIELYPKDGYTMYTLAYKIEPSGQAAYENYIQGVEAHNFQKRQTEATENSVVEARKANQKSSFSIILSVIAIIVSIIAIIVQVYK